MRIRKIAAAMLALIVAICLAMSAFAATGYYKPKKKTKKKAYTPPSSQSEIVPVYAETQTGTNIEQATRQATQQLANQQADQQENPSDGDRIIVKLENVTVLPAEWFKQIFSDAEKDGISNTVVHIDVKEGGAVLSRIYVNAKTAAKLSGGVDFSVSTKGAAIENVVNKFESTFDNNIAAINLGQEGTFGAKIKMAVKVDLSRLDTDNLVFYAYSKERGKYTRINTAYKIDGNGYLHFLTPVGGDIIISDKPLARKET